MQSYLRTNMMSLCFSGCSITYGIELEKPEEDRYSRIVSDHYGVSDNNISQSGSSNDDIVRRTIKYLNKNPVDIVVIQFTYIARYQWIDGKGKTYNWTPSSENAERHKHTPRKEYYKHVYNDNCGIENAWKNIFLFTEYCKSKNQKYIPLINCHNELLYERDSKWKKIYNCPVPTVLSIKKLHPSKDEHKFIAGDLIRRIDEITL